MSSAMSGVQWTCIIIFLTLCNKFFILVNFRAVLIVCNVNMWTLMEDVFRSAVEATTETKLITNAKDVTKIVIH